MLLIVRLVMVIWSCWKTKITPTYYHYTKTLYFKNSRRKFRCMWLICKKSWKLGNINVLNKNVPFSCCFVSLPAFFSVNIHNCFYGLELPRHISTKIYRLYNFYICSHTSKISFTDNMFEASEE